MFDSHCHIQFRGYKDDFEEVIKRCKEKDCAMIAVGTQKDTSKKAIEFAEKYENIYATVGLHPIHLFSTHVDEEEASFLSREEEFDYEFYKELAQHPKVIGIGECGLDLFHIPENVDRDIVVKKQKEIFLEQVKLARELDLPVAIHVRDAYEEMLEVIANCRDSRSAVPTIRGVIHCYSSNWQNAQKFLDLGLYIGFTGIITFPPKKTDPQVQHDLLEVVEKIPLDRILIETDAPYLAPQAYRGKRCEPWMVEEVAKKIAEIRDLSFEEIIKITTENIQKLFKKIIRDRR